MARPFAYIFRGEEFVPIQAICATYCVRSARAYWGRKTEVLPAPQNLFLDGFQPSEPVQKALRISFLRDSSPITLSPFLSGIETCCRTSRRRSIIVNVLYLSPLYLSFDSREIVCAIFLMIAIKNVPWYEDEHVLR